MQSETKAEQPRTITVGSGSSARTIAFRTQAGDAPALVWLGGYRSDMHGTKAEHLAQLAEKQALAFCRLDYSGHGESGGRFEDGTIGRWTEEAAAVIDAAVDGPAILIGSSMGAWIALRLVQTALAAGKPAEVAGLLLLAPAPDFTHRLMEPKLRDDQRAALERDGFIAEPSDYSPEPNIYTRKLFEDGAANLVMEGLIETRCPVTIIQGMADQDVPFAHALELVTHLPSEGVIVTLIRDGDHRLSRPQDLELIERAALDLVTAARDGS
ncbi:alpha/beta hydrolase [Aurantimonas sp. A3-2-R12]|uniref:alpha/beta hydrolase n=1 Tax=Aurantimonas sp. A3-2-R12 TaxID=3114362 RepID=UPI002E18A00E|nr:alpha/beta hydrolase [Aurantimonas sp. A3-2-R12]